MLVFIPTIPGKPLGTHCHHPCPESQGPCAGSRALLLKREGTFPPFTGKTPFQSFQGKRTGAGSCGMVHADQGGKESPVENTGNRGMQRAGPMVTLPSSASSQEQKQADEPKLGSIFQHPKTLAPKRWYSSTPRYVGLVQIMGCFLPS